jgi:hypothetical protein
MSKEQQLNSDTITFGKYKNGTLQQVLRDRSYCTWLLQQEWFQNNYEYLHNRVQEYEPLPFFFQKPPNEDDGFLVKYQFFNLTPVEEVKLSLSDDEKKCYAYYLKMITELKDKIEGRLDTDNPYDIKAPCRWLLRFEKENELKRTVFKEFINAHELPNIPYLVERIKKEGGIKYLGAQSFNIAKERSLEQEAYWEKILKEKYGEDLGSQFAFSSCIFDFIIISKQLIIEAKLGLKDFNLEQYVKYKTALEKYKIIYLIGKDAVIVMEEQVIYTTDVNKYTTYQFGILSSKYTGKFDEEIREYIIVHVDDLSICL